MQHSDKNPRVELFTDAGARATLSRYGAQVLSWQPLPNKAEQLFLSSAANYDGRTAIRGGIPVLFPYFGRREALPSHGFARLSDWELVSIDNGAEKSTAVLTLRSSELTQKIWPHEFMLTLIVTLQGAELCIDLQVLNSGNSTVSFSGGLHSYFAVDQIAQSQIRGLSGCEYIEQGKRFFQESASLIVDKAIDRIYLSGGKQSLSLITPQRCVAIESVGFKESVVWNPWREGALQLADFNPQDYKKMVCIESVMAHEQVVLAAGETWSGGQHLTVSHV